MVSPDILFNLIEGLGAIDQDNPILFARCQISVGLSDALIKLVRFLFHSIGTSRFLQTRLGGLRVDIQHDSQIWNAIADRELVQLIDGRAASFRATP